MLKMWGRNTSSNVQKAMWAVAELKLPCERIDVGGAYGKTKEPFYLAMNPNSLVPTLEEEDGFTLWESNSIVRYLAMQYAPDLLYGNDIKTFASASRWADWENNELLPPQHNMAMHLIRLPENKRDPKVLADACEKFARAIKIADDQLGRTRYIAGDRFTYGDIPLGLRVHRWHVLGLAQETPPNIARWYTEIKARPAFNVYTADPAHHLEG